MLTLIIVHYSVYLELGIVDNSLDTISSLHYSFIYFIVVLTIETLMCALQI